MLSVLFLTKYPLWPHSSNLYAALSIELAILVIDITGNSDELKMAVIKCAK